MNCPSEEQMLRLLDGGIAPNQAEGIHSHVTGCSACRGRVRDLETFLGDLAAPVAVDEEAHVARVMSRLGEAAETARHPESRRLPRYKALAGGGVAALALAAGVLLFARDRGAEPAPSFEARGSKAIPTLARDVGVRVFSGDHDPAPLTEGAEIRADATLTATYTNLYPRPVFLLVFAVDANHDVHWLYPAYTTAGDDPPSVSLERTDHPRSFPTSVVLGAPAQGPLRIVSIATDSPLHVSDIERRSASALATPALRVAFSQAAISELRVQVLGAP